MHTTTIEIPNKNHFKVNEVCNIVGIKPYVLRYWETEFDQIQPQALSSGQKVYDQKDVEIIALIKKFLFTDKMSIEKAKMEMDRLVAFVPETPIVEPEVKAKVVENISSDTEEQEEVTQAHSLSDSDLQKLVMAKAKLSSLMMQLEGVQKSHNWI